MRKSASTSVPAAMRPAYEAVVALTDAFCREQLDDDYRDLARRMAAALSRKRPSPLASGKPKSWACGIVYDLGRINFLSDPATKPHMKLAEVCAGFGVGESTGNEKARVISQALGTSRMDPDWCLPSLIAQNPLLWLAEVDGLLVDLRRAPRPLQEFAFRLGVIPFIPDEAGGDAGAGAPSGERDDEQP